MQTLNGALIRDEKGHFAEEALHYEKRREEVRACNNHILQGIFI